MTSRWRLVQNNLAHAQRCSKGAVGRRKRRHHRVADGLDHGASLRRHDRVQQVKMLPYQLIGDQITDPRIKLGRALEIGEKERETHDLEALVHSKRVGAVKISKRLVGEDALRREVWSAL